jgi:hypothetical protein
VPFIIGTDEAGYGPNLGPLIVTATLWHVPAGDDPAVDVLADTLEPATAVGAGLPGPSPEPVVIADSKTIYNSGGGLVGLERGVYAALSHLGQRPTRWREMWPLLAPGAAERLVQIPWYAGYDRALPVDLDPQLLSGLGEPWRKKMRERQVTLLAIRAAVVCAEQFNEAVDLLGSKGELLSRVTLGLVRELLPTADPHPRHSSASASGWWATPDADSTLVDDALLVHCDKHGGRNKYGPLLQTLFPEHLIEIHEETRACSVYRTGPRPRRCEFRFQARGERFLPVALASMVAKYLRELAMLAFNAFWQQHLPALRPTAGYPVDARRFRADIAACQARLQIPDRILWRSR